MILVLNGPVQSPVDIKIRSSFYLSIYSVADCTNKTGEFGIATMLPTGEWRNLGFYSQQGQDFLYSTASRPTPGLTQSPVQFIQGSLSQSLKKTGMNAIIHLHLLVRVKNVITPLPYTS
jgi:hypothetical protein